jgi:hypothetical protein
MALISRTLPIVLAEAMFGFRLDRPLAGDMFTQLETVEIFAIFTTESGQQTVRVAGNTAVTSACGVFKLGS